MRGLILILSLVIIITSCTTAGKSVSSNTITSVGVTCGMCLGKCYNGYRINEGVVEHFSADRPDKMDSALIEKVTVEQEKAFRNLVSLLPSNLDTYPDRVGCPDCHDQCGVRVVTAAKTITIDPADYPAEFNAFMDKLKAMEMLNRR